jgi:hypothetical protein
MWILNISSSTWTQIQHNASCEWPISRFGAISFVAENTLYMFGGGHSGTSSWLNDTWALDLTTFVWKELFAATPTAPARSSGKFAQVLSSVFKLSWGFFVFDVFITDI